MAFFEQAELDDLKIHKMVFHLVGPSEADFVTLDAVDPGKFNNFFIDRIRSVNSGVPYTFTDASSTRERLSRISENPDLFQTESEKLAEDFQRLHGGGTAPGAFLVFHLKADQNDVFALLKYDDETVLTYDVKEHEDGRRYVKLDEIERTFVQNPNALQKSALIRLTDDGLGSLTVLDRRNQQKVARYFENFLAAKRVHDDARLTEILANVTRDVIRRNKTLVEDNVYREAGLRSYNAAAAGGELKGDEQRRFLEAVIGKPLPDDSPLLVKFANALRTARIEAVPVKLDATSLRRPSVMRYVTKNNIQIRAPTDMLERVVVEDDRIIINDEVDRSYDDTAKDS
ncbi:nucleoid-associated protein [uncultured Brevundimonas sp.]|uniref:nucleoid-associated protein n=1 Tax=uncultured Brevundimonas sp. TaxID=213418 RepID=UPI00262E82B6|nr:nucleoid-associated protein [uncultured Brevundimonas sp.]